MAAPSLEAGKKAAGPSASVDPAASETNALSRGKELSDSELDQVVGGSSCIRP